MSIPSLKRKRSSSPEWVPPPRVNPALPGLSGDALLTVFTHPSLAVNPLIPDNLRFQTLGGIALEYVVARLILAQGQQAPDQILNENMKTILSDENIAGWAKDYRLRERLRYGPAAASSVDKDTEQASLFKAYAGAVDQEHGPTVLINWIEALINAPAVDVVQTPPAAPPPVPQVKAGTFSALINEKAQLHKHMVNFVSESTGLAHSLTWTVHVHSLSPIVCTSPRAYNLPVDGVQEASGQGSTKATAKEEAAQAVCHKKGWAT